MNFGKLALCNRINTEIKGKLWHYITTTQRTFHMELYGRFQIQFCISLR